MVSKLYCAGVMLAVASVLTAEPAAAQKDEAALIGDAPLSPKQFAQRMRADGGRLDFVFGAERPFAQCHASSIVENKSGELLCAWFAGTEEKSPDVGIWHSRFAKGVWSEPSLLIKVNETAHWNPVLFRDDEGVVYLFFKVGPEIPYWQTYWMQSEDGGDTWSEPKQLVEGDKGGRGPVRSKPIVTSSDTWLAGASTEQGAWDSFADLSDDQGATWERTPDFTLPDAPGQRGAIQPTVWESEPGNVHALLRTRSGQIWRVDSTDGGKTWSDAYDTGLPNNNSGVDVVYHDESDRLFLIYNPVRRNWGPRTPLTLAVSNDNGETWSKIAHLEDDPDPESEFSYPAMVETDDGLAISYTYQRERVRVWQIPLESL